MTDTEQQLGNATIAGLIASNLIEQPYTPEVHKGFCDFYTALLKVFMEAWKHADEVAYNDLVVVLLRTQAKTLTKAQLMGYIRAAQMACSTIVSSAVVAKQMHHPAEVYLGLPEFDSMREILADAVLAIKEAEEAMGLTDPRQS